jgi:hypothetical protein
MDFSTKCLLDKDGNILLINWDSLNFAIIGLFKILINMVSLKYVGNQYHWACGTAVYKTIF